MGDAPRAERYVRYLTVAQYAKRISYLIGPDGRVRKAFPKVNAAAHPEEILKDL